MMKRILVAVEDEPYPNSPDGILDGIPQANQFPIFVREKSTSLSNGKITSIEELKKLHAYRIEELIFRPFVDIEPCLKRASVRKELRVHVVFG